MENALWGVGIIGTGWVATEYLAAFSQNPHSQVVALCSRSEEKGRARAQECGLKTVDIYTDVQKMLENPNINIVAICSPNFLHAKQTIQAAKAGKHIVIEKPVALNLHDLKDMRDTVRKAKVKTIVSFVLRWNPLFETIKAMLADDFIGDIYYVDIDYQHFIGPQVRPDRWEWIRKTKTSGGSFLHGGCHAMDALRWFSAKNNYETEDIIEVFAREIGYRKGRDVDWHGHSVALVKFQNGALGKVSSNLDCIMPYNFPISIFGDKGTIKDNRIWSHKFCGQSDWTRIPTILPDSGDVRHHPFQTEINHFIQCIKNNSESHCNLEDAINTHEACIATTLSAHKNKPIKLPLIQ